MLRGLEALWSPWIGISAPYPCATALTLALVLALALALALAPARLALALLGICNYVELIDTIFTDVEGVD